MSEWTDELKAEVVKEYENREPTPENSMNIVMELAEEYDKTPNGVRQILSKAGVYVKKTPSASTTKKSSGGGTPRVSKAEQIQALKDVITEAGGEVEDEILDKLTGKAAAYLVSVFGSNG